MTGDLGGYGMVWDLRTGKGIYDIKQNDSILCSRFHPNGFELAVAGKANVISIFDLRRKKELKSIPAHLKLISDVKYDENGNFLASVSHDNSIRLWHGRNYSTLPIDDLV
jgi:U4/U6 small nuclear ribonucleoprotein PRP4